MTLRYAAHRSFLSWRYNLRQWVVPGWDDSDESRYTAHAELESTASFYSDFALHPTYQKMDYMRQVDWNGGEFLLPTFRRAYDGYCKKTGLLQNITRKFFLQ